MGTANRSFFSTWIGSGVLLLFWYTASSGNGIFGKRLLQEFPHPATLTCFQLIVEQARKNGAVVTAEDHNIIGGLGDAVLEVLSDNDVTVPFRRIGVRDTFAETGSMKELYFKYGLSAQHIENTVRSLLK